MGRERVFALNGNVETRTMRPIVTAAPSRTFIQLNSSAAQPKRIMARYAFFC